MIADVKGHNRTAALLPPLACGLGLWFTLGGLVHWGGIVGHWLKTGLPEPVKAAYLLIIGSVQIAAGLLHWLGGTGMRRGERNAKYVCLVACFLVCVYAGTTLALLAPPKGFLCLLLVLYLVSHLGFAGMLITHKISDGNSSAQ